MESPSCVVIGAGIFGVTAALELRARGHAVDLLDPGPLPHPLAASTDISKVCRLEYGGDREYGSLAKRALGGWDLWNAELRALGRDALYHQSGLLMLAGGAIEPGGFEQSSAAQAAELGAPSERLAGEAIMGRFPAWSTGLHRAGYFQPRAGYAESGRVVSFLLERARAAGVRLVEGFGVSSLERRGGRVVAAISHEDERREGAHFVVAAGVWTAGLIEELRPCLRASGHPVFHLAPKRPELFEASRFPVFTADITKTGFYGFPLNRDGVVKIARHASGEGLEADAPRVVGEEQHARLRAFLAAALPDLLDAEVVFTRLCLYCDSQDGDFWIARHPKVEGLTVCSGGSGHGFKFAPVLGELAADAVEGRMNPMLARMAWRADLRLAESREGARCHDEA
jgi:sarcosine oxidase / L-pipecolate oxidase